MLQQQTALKALKEFFKKNKITKIPNLCSLLNTTSRISVLRRLKELDYISSYTHGGSYYTLPSLAKFNTDGLWHYAEAGFSCHGNLKKTIVQLIEQSKNGKTQKALKIQLKICTHNTLLKLVHSNKITRKRIDGVFLYMNANLAKAKQQMEYHNKNKENLYNEVSDWILIEVLLEIIQMNELEANNLQIAAQLNARGVAVNSMQITHILKRFNIKKLRI